MKNLKQFILCNGKIPVHSDGHTIDPHNPVNWMSYTSAKAATSVSDYGIGFVFTNADDLWFLDLDSCLVNGEWSELAVSLCKAFPGAHVEVSQSGEGLHIFGSGTVPEHSCKNKLLGIEFYHTGRFALLTTDLDGDYHGNAGMDFTPQVKWLVDSYFPPSEAGDSAQWSNIPVPEWSGPVSDDELIAKMMKSGSARAMFGNKATFKDLFENNATRLGECYPNQNKNDPYDRSSADAAIAGHLAFWTGKNSERMRTIMNRSALVRDKWTKHKNYLVMTITGAVNSCQNVYGATRVKQDDPSPATTKGTLTTGSQFMSADQQLTYFENCIYLKNAHRVLVPNGFRMKPEVFKASYAGYTFAMDTDNIKTTRNAFEALIDNQAIKFPKVDSTAFRPDLPPYTIIEDEGLTKVNTYIPIKINRTKGDVAPFLIQMKKLFPLPGDYNIILAYIAAVVQHQGYKFQWCPIIQGTEGNAKTFIGNAVAAAVGYRYSHFPNAQDLGGNGLKFNGWILDKTFVFIEEIYTSDKRQITEALKTFVTNSKIEIQFKGQDQFVGDNFANIMMCSNHKNCITMTFDGRRYWMHYTPQQSAADLARDGMTPAYFKALYDWANTGGWAIIAEYLWTYTIPDELNPATGQRAPESSSKIEAVRESLGIVEQNIMEAIEEEQVGFRGGYISSKALKNLLIEMKMDNRLSPQRRSGILNSLGYFKHPALGDRGRVDNVIAAEGSKSMIFTNLPPDASLTGPAEVKRLYELAQGYIKQ